MSERSLRKPKSMLTKELGVGARVDGLKRERRPTLTRGRLHARHDIGDRFGCHRLILVAIVGGVPQRLTCHSAAAAAFVAPPLVSSRHGALSWPSEGTIAWVHGSAGGAAWRAGERRPGLPIPKPSRVHRNLLKYPIS